MSTVAYFSDFTGSTEEEQTWREQLKGEMAADRLVAVMSGDFLQWGLPATESRETRAGKALKAGIDMVVEMSFLASLSSIGIFAFSAARILDKLEAVDMLVLETEEADRKQLMEITYILIANTKEFQQRVSHYKASGMPFYEAQAEAVGEKIENGRQLMSSWHNIFAVECMKALKLMYSGIQCICVPKRKRQQAEPVVWGEAVENGRDIPWADDRQLSALLKYQLYFSEPHLSDIYGGYEELTNQILEHREEFDGFLQFAALIAGSEKDLFDVRKFFLRLLCGVTKSTISIWRMYDFAPYCSVYARDGQVLEEMRESSKIPLLVQPLQQQSGQQLDRSKQELLELEKRAGQICRLL